MFCNDCGVKVPDGKDFCSGCGSKVNKPEQITQSTDTSECISCPKCNSRNIQVSTDGNSTTYWVCTKCLHKFRKIEDEMTGKLGHLVKWMVFSVALIFAMSFTIDATTIRIWRLDFDISTFSTILTVALGIACVISIAMAVACGRDFMKAKKEYLATKNDDSK